VLLGRRGGRGSPRFTRRRYGLAAYLAGATAARTADEMSAPALLLLGLAVTGSARTASALYAGLTISAAAGGPVLGALLDRSGRPGRLLAWTLTGYAAGLAVIAVSLGHIPSAAVVAAAVLAGFLAPSLTGGWTSRLPDILTPDRLTSGYSLDAGTYSAAALAGPAMAGLIAAAVGAGWAMAMVTVLLVAATPAAWLIPVVPARHQAAAHGAADGGTAGPGGAETGVGQAGIIEAGSAEAGTHGATSLLSDLRAGFGVIVSNGPLLRITVCSVVAYLGVGMLVVACPLLGERHLGGADRGALLLSVLAATSLATNAVLSRWPARLAPDTVFALATVLAGCAYAGLAVAPSAGWVIAAVAVAGVADGPQLAAIFAVRHREAPQRLRGQVFTTAASLKITAGAVGAVLAGQLAGQPTGHPSHPGSLAAAHSTGVLMLVAALTQAAALAVFPALSFRRRSLPR
jgi:MFS family permease